jgi:hypothetical protein
MPVHPTFFAPVPGHAAPASRPQARPVLHGLGLATLLAAAGLPPVLHAQSASFGGTAALSSQLVDRGLAVTSATPVLQAAGTVSFPAAGWSLGVSGSAEARSPGRVVEALAQASRAWTLGDAWQMQAGLLYYTYPSDHARARLYDRNELALGWSYRDVLSFGVSAIRATHGENHRLRGAADLDLRWPLALGVSLTAGAGVAQGPSWPYGYDYTTRYGYGHAGLMWDNGPWRLELERVVVGNRQVRGGPGRPDLSPWVATLSWSF